MRVSIQRVRFMRVSMRVDSMSRVLNHEGLISEGLKP